MRQNRSLQIMYRILLLLALIILGSAPRAHEFWIEPAQYDLQAGKQIIARFRNGENLKGSEVGFFDRRSARLEVAHGGRITKLRPRNGNRPAMVLAPMGDGLHVLLHETTPATLTYKSWEKFADFAKHKDFANIEARHMARDLPRDGFKERYSRHVKALVNVGAASGADRYMGLATEFVALTNPYLSDFAGMMRVRLFDRGTPRPDAQVEVFEQDPDGAVSVTLTRTDHTGMAQIATTPGHTYLLDAVILRDAVEPGFAWETFWAALTFAVPAR